jgi:diguanylate cyclase (GGDEF)-like protein
VTEGTIGIRFLFLSHVIFILSLVTINILTNSKFISIIGLVNIFIVLSITDLVIYKIFYRQQYFAELSKRDSLTGLYNYKYFYDTLTNFLSNGKDEISVILIDIDDFKKINDSFGHLVGDRVLIELADILRLNTRKTDVIVRYGGEEFAIILKSCSITEALEMAERLRGKVENYLFALNIEGFSGITISVGVSNFPHNAMSSIELVKAADEAMYCAKRQGKNRVVSSTYKQSSCNIAIKEKNNSKIKKVKKVSNIST